LERIGHHYSRHGRTRNYADQNEWQEGKNGADHRMESLYVVTNISDQDGLFNRCFAESIVGARESGIGGCRTTPPACSLGHVLGRRKGDHRHSELAECRGHCHGCSAIGHQTQVAANPSLPDLCNSLAAPSTWLLGSTDSESWTENEGLRPWHGVLSLLEPAARKAKHSNTLRVTARRG